MKSTGRGRDTSDVEVTAVSERGITVHLDGKRQFLSYREFPWFKGAPKGHVMNVRRLGENHLMWPDLDVELEVDSLKSPERYPLISGQNPVEPDSRAKPRKKGRS